VFFYTHLYNVRSGLQISEEGTPETTHLNRYLTETNSDGFTINSVEKIKNISNNTYSHNNSRDDSTVTVATNVLADTPNSTDNGVTDNYDTIRKLRDLIYQINDNGSVVNGDKFSTFDLVMIIQVHRRTEYLKMLVESLRLARDISKVLVVVSFDYYDKETLSVVEKIDFCKVTFLLVHAVIVRSFVPMYHSCIKCIVGIRRGGAMGLQPCGLEYLNLKIE